MKDAFSHFGKRRGLFKFLALLVVLVSYFAYLSWTYDFATGRLVSALTWSFFVLCTPIADAGFLIDFPVRLILGLRMFITELFVWVLAISLNLATLKYVPDDYEKSVLTSLLHKILITPWPYWSIIVLCAVGTFLSIHFGDEVVDAVSHDHHLSLRQSRSRYKLIGMAVIFVVVLVLYYRLIAMLDVKF